MTLKAHAFKLQENWNYRLFGGVDSEGKPYRRQWITENGPLRSGPSGGLQFVCGRDDYYSQVDRQRRKNRAELVRVGFGDEGVKGYRTDYSITFRLGEGYTENSDFRFVAQTHTSKVDPGYWAWNLNIIIEPPKRFYLQLELAKRNRDGTPGSAGRVSLPINRHSTNVVDVNCYYTSWPLGYVEMKVNGKYAGRIRGVTHPGNGQPVEFKVGHYKGHGIQETDSFELLDCQIREKRMYWWEALMQ